MDINVVIGIISIMIGLLALLGIRITFRKKIPWRYITKGFKKVEPEIRRMNPDVVVGIADGVVTAAIIFTNLRIPLFYALDLPITYDEEKKRITKISGDVGNLTGKKVLVVDNHIYTGTNMAAAVDFLKRKNPNDIKTLVLFKHEMEGAKYKPEYFAYIIKKSRKKVPWSYTKEHETAYYT